MRSATAALCLVVAGLAIAAAHPAAQAGNVSEGGHHHGIPECATVREACEKGGYRKGSHKEKAKGIFRDCIQPLTEGKRVKGVNMEPDNPAIAICARAMVTSGKASPKKKASEAGVQGKKKPQH